MDEQVAQGLQILLSKIKELSVTCNVHAMILKDILGASPELTATATARLEQVRGQLLNTTIGDDLIEMAAKELASLLPAP